MAAQTMQIYKNTPFVEFRSIKRAKFQFCQAFCAKIYATLSTSTLSSKTAMQCS